MGRQLFVDDILIEKTDMKPVFHSAVKYEGNLVLYPEREYETKENYSVACPISGGVWYDEEAIIFKMWHHAGWQHRLCYAISHNGTDWEKPDLDVVKGTNLILDYDVKANMQEAIKTNPELYLRPDTSSFIIDYEDDKCRKHKMYLTNPIHGYLSIIATSGDGIHFENNTMTTKMGDCSTAFYNPFRKNGCIL